MTAIAPTASSRRISTYLNDLALNPKKLAAHRRDPAAAMADSPLFTEERAVVERGDEATLYQAITGSLGNPMAPAVVVVAVFVIVHNPQCR